MIKKIPNSDKSIRPFKVYKQWSFTHESSEIDFLEIYDGELGSFDPETADLDQKVNDDGDVIRNLYKVPLWRSIRKQYYSTDVMGVDSLGDRKNRLSDDERTLTTGSVKIVNIPPDVYGESIKRRSVSITDTSTEFHVADDGYGNLIPSDATFFELIELDLNEGFIEFKDMETIYKFEIVDDSQLDANNEGVIELSDGTDSVEKVIAIIDNEHNLLIFEEQYETIFGIQVNQFPLGQVFYKQGLIVLGNFERNIKYEFNQFNLDFKSTTTIYEHEYFLQVGESEFNVSQNPTAVEYRDGVPFVRSSFPTETTGSIGEPSGSFVFPDQPSGSFKDYEKRSLTDPTGSYLAPYITTIALYDDEMNIVATAKVTKPIKNLPDYPVNFIVRFDT